MRITMLFLICILLTIKSFYGVSKLYHLFKWHKIFVNIFLSVQQIFVNIFQQWPTVLKPEWPDQILDILQTGVLLIHLFLQHGHILLRLSTRTQPFRPGTWKVPKLVQFNAKQFSTSRFLVKLLFLLKFLKFLRWISLYSISCCITGIGAFGRTGIGLNCWIGTGKDSSQNVIFASRGILIDFTMFSR